MAAVKVFRGDTWKRAWLLKNDDGSPINLAGSSARLHVRDTAGVKVVEASIADGRLAVTPASGRIDMIIPAGAMNITPGAYRFELEVTNAGGEVRTIEQSTLVVIEDITHD